MKKTINFNKNCAGCQQEKRIEKLLPKKKIFTSLPQPKKAKCFQCQTNFYIKFVVPQKNYSQKNN
jgi:hypothetical protein